MIYFDMVANLMHDIWKGLAPLPIRALFFFLLEIFFLYIYGPEILLSDTTISYFSILLL